MLHLSKLEKELKTVDFLSNGFFVVDILQITTSVFIIDF